MSNTPKRRTVRQSDFTVVARGIRRVTPDYSRLLQATIEHHTTAADPGPAAGRSRPAA